MPAFLFVRIPMPFFPGCWARLYNVLSRSEFFPLFRLRYPINLKAPNPTIWSGNCKSANCPPEVVMALMEQRKNDGLERVMAENILLLQEGVHRYVKVPLEILALQLDRKFEWLTNGSWLTVLPGDWLLLSYHNKAFDVWGVGNEPMLESYTERDNVPEELIYQSIIGTGVDNLKMLDIRVQYRLGPVDPAHKPGAFKLQTKKAGVLAFRVTDPDLKVISLESNEPYPIEVGDVVCIGAMGEPWVLQTAIILAHLA